MSYTVLNENDSVETMLTKLEKVTKHLSLITGSYGSYEYEYDNGYYRSAKPFWTTCKVYTGDDVLQLKANLKHLTHEINAILKAKKEDLDYPKIEGEAMRILLATHEAIVNPSNQNFKKLDKIASEVQGHGNVWVKVGIVLAAIIGFLLVVFPGFIILDETQDDWNNATQKGLSLLADTINNQIQNTEGAGRCKEYGFFKQSDDLVTKINEAENTQTAIISSKM